MKPNKRMRIPFEGLLGQNIDQGRCQVKGCIYDQTKHVAAWQALSPFAGFRP
jgi:hypothetical protein